MQQASAASGNAAASSKPQVKRANKGAKNAIQTILASADVPISFGGGSGGTGKTAGLNDATYS